MENRSRWQAFLDCSESSFASFEHARKLESAGNRVRLCLNVDQRRQSLFLGRSGACDYERRHFGRNLPIVIIDPVAGIAEPRFGILTEGMHDRPAFDQIMILGVNAS